MNDIPTVEDLVPLNILLYDIDIVDGNIVGEFARRSVQKCETTGRLLRYNNHICYVNNINAVFQSFRFPNCDTFVSRTFTLERHLTTCKERVKNVYPKNVCQTQETLLETPNSVGLSADQIQGVYTNVTPFVEDLLTLNILLYDIVLWMATLSENLQDGVCRNTTTLSDCSGTLIIYVM